jgi:hypothetical protein
MEANMASALTKCLTAILLVSACDPDDKGTTPPAGTTGVCPTDCLTATLQSCHPQGACVVEAAGPVNAARGELWLCFENGVRIHVTGSSSTSMHSSVRVIEDQGKLCRTIEAEEGAAGGLFTVKNELGQISVTMRYADYPSMTVSCGGADYAVDRRTECGKMALLSMAPEFSLVQSCKSGPCKPP